MTAIKKVGLAKNKQNTTLIFSNKELEYFASLLYSGCRFKEAVKLIGKDYSLIEQEIAAGKKPETVIIEATHGKTKQLLIFFTQVNSLPNAITATLKMINFEHDMRDKIIKKCTYPLFILLFSFVTVYLFSEYIIPQLLNNFGEKTSSLFAIVLLIKQTAIIIAVCFKLIIVFIICFIISYRFKIVTIPFICIFFPLFKDFLAYRLSGYLFELNSTGLSTKECFIFLCKLKQNSSLYYLSMNIAEQLKQGMDLERIIETSSLLSKRFKLCYSIGSGTNTFEETLNQFNQISEERFNFYIRYISLAIQIIAYVFVAVLIICVYQIMLIPLNMLESI